MSNPPEMKDRRRPDPAVVAADIWREAEAGRDKAEGITRAVQKRLGTSNGPATDTLETADRIYNEHWELHWAALSRLYTTRPTTIKGAIAMLIVMLESDDGTLDHPDIGAGLGNVLAYLQWLDGRG